MKNITCFVFACLVGAAAQAQNKDNANQETVLQPFKNIAYKAETQLSASNHRTPLWLNANKYGLSSLESANGYVRVGVERTLQTDSAKRWAIGYGLDVVAPWHYNSKLIVQQAYAEVTNFWHQCANYSASALVVTTILAIASYQWLDTF